MSRYTAILDYLDAMAEDAWLRHDYRHSRDMLSQRVYYREIAAELDELPR